MKKTTRRVSRLNPFNWDWSELVIILITSIAVVFLIAYFTRNKDIVHYSSYGFFVAAFIRMNFWPLQGDVVEVPCEWTEKKVTYKHKTFNEYVPVKTEQKIFYKGEWYVVDGSERDV